MKNEEFNDSKIMKDQAKMREEIMSSKEEAARDLRPTIEKMIKDFPNIDTSMMCIAIMPMMLDEFKESDPEFYYVTRSKLTAFAESLLQWNKRLVETLEKSKEMKRGPDTAKN